MKIYLDDVRPTPVGWIRCYWPDEVIDLLKTNKVTHVSLDHDLGDDLRGTGVTVVNWIEEQVACHDFVPPIMTIHSDNGPGIQNMRRGINRIIRFLEEKIELQLKSIK